MSALNVRPHRPTVTPVRLPPTAPRIFSIMRSCWASLTSTTPREQIEGVTGRTGDVEQRLDVLREARTAVARARVEELKADAGVVAHSDRDFVRVGVDRLAQVRDRVDERHLGGEERVRRVLDHLGRGGVGDEHRRLDPLVELAHAHGRLAVVTTDDDAVGVQEVADGLALAQELGVRRDGDALGARTGLRQDPLYEARRTDGNRRLVDDDRVRREDRCDLAGDALDERQVGRTVGALRRLHAHEHDLGVLRGGRCADDELEPAGREALLEELRQTELEDRDLALFQARDPLGIDVSAQNIVSKVRETRSSGQSNVSGADDRDSHDRPGPRHDMTNQSRGARTRSLQLSSPLPAADVTDVAPAAAPAARSGCSRPSPRVVDFAVGRVRPL